MLCKPALVFLGIWNSAVNTVTAVEYSLLNIQQSVRLMMATMVHFSIAAECIQATSAGITLHILAWRLESTVKRLRGSLLYDH